MLKKLLKYDLKSIFKYWWIAAVSSFALSFLGGGCIGVLRSEKDLPLVVNMMSGLVLILVVLGFCVFSILSLILIFVRFYKNFFTDEGYLTFTLPVKRAQLLNSKLIMSTTTLFLTGVVLVMNMLFMLAIGFSDVVFSQEFLKEIFEIIKVIFEEAGVYVIIYIVEALILILLSIIFSNLFMFCCITFASIITKKAKVITAIAIYYVANSVFSFVFQMFYLFGITSIASWMSDLPIGSDLPVVALILLGIIFFFSVFCSILYTLQYWMIDRKLNLS